MPDRLAPSVASDEVLAWRADWIAAASLGPDVVWLGYVCGAALLLASLYRPGPGADGGWSPPVSERDSRVLSGDGASMPVRVYLGLERLGVIAVRHKGARVLGYRLVPFDPTALDWQGCGRVLAGWPG